MIRDCRTGEATAPPNFRDLLNRNFNGFGRERGNFGSFTTSSTVPEDATKKSSYVFQIIVFPFLIVLAKECLTKSEFEFVKYYFWNNSYMAHPESILLAMLFDSNRSVRAKAVDLILSAKKPGKKPRKFVKPDLKYDAKNYYEMIDWKKIKITVPAPVKKFTKEELRSCIAGNDLDIPHIPCHSTNNERYI